MLETEAKTRTAKVRAWTKALAKAWIRAWAGIRTAWAVWTRALAKVLVWASWAAKALAEVLEAEAELAEARSRAALERTK